MHPCCSYIYLQVSILAHFPFPAKVNVGIIWDRHLAISRYLGKIWDGRETVKSPMVWDFPDIRKLGLNTGDWKATKFAVCWRARLTSRLCKKCFRKVESLIKIMKKASYKKTKVASRQRSLQCVQQNKSPRRDKFYPRLITFL